MIKSNIPCYKHLEHYSNWRNWNITKNQINLLEDYNEFCRLFPESDMEFKIPGILKNMRKYKLES